MSRAIYIGIVAYVRSQNSTSEPQKITLKVFVTDVIAISSTEPARLSVLQVSGIHR